MDALHLRRPELRALAAALLLALAPTPAAARDGDGDGVPDAEDSCPAVANPVLESRPPGRTTTGGQLDDDADGLGNPCDADLDGDGIVGLSDFFSVFRPCLGATVDGRAECAVADLDGDGVVAPADFFGHLRPALFRPLPALCPSCPRACAGPGCPAEPSRLGPSIVRVSGRRLLVERRLADGRLTEPRPYVIRGVNWSPASPDTATRPDDPANAAVRRREFWTWYQSDIPLLVEMNANTVRLPLDPGFEGELGARSLALLDELYRAGILVILTVDDGVNDLDRIRGAVPFFRDHPAVLLWSLGSEWNLNRYFGVASSVEDAARRTEEAARLVKSLDDRHPVVSSYGEIDLDADGLRLADTRRIVRELVPSADLWSLNIYRGESFDDADGTSLFAQWAALSEKPVFLGEFGVDAFRAACPGEAPAGAVDEAAQAAWDVALWDDILRHLAVRPGEGVAVGGAVFEWNDEWWKVPPPGSQESAGWSSDGFPDRHAAEEFFGLVDIARRPRAAHRALGEAFRPAREPPPRTVTFRALSRGSSVCAAGAAFRRDGHTFHEATVAGGGRGIHLVVIDPAAGSVAPATSRYDIAASPGRAGDLARDLAALPDGRLVLLAVAGDAGLAEGPDCHLRSQPEIPDLVAALEALGSSRIRDACPGASWALVAVAGSGSALAESLGTGVEAEAVGLLPVR